MRNLLIATLVIAVLGFSKAAGPINQNRVFQIEIHDVNQVEMCVSNFGKFGQTTGGAAGGWWPVGSGHSYIYGAGSWFGTVDTVTGDTMVTIGYGPHGGEKEYGPGLAGWSISDPQAILFMYPETWTQIDYTRLPMAPTATKSHQDSWCVYNDLDITQHVPGDTKPIGLEVYQTVYAWNLSTTQDIIFIKYELKNVSGKELTNCYFGVCCDNDIGNEASGSANDRISGIVGQWFVIPGEPDPLWVDNLGYQWQEETETGWAEFPGVLGYDYLQSPWDLPDQPGIADKDSDDIDDYYEMDSAWFMVNHPSPDSLWDADQDGTPDWKDPSQIPQIGMTAFKRFTLSLEPNKDNERYVTLAGYNFKTGVYEPYDTFPPPGDDQRFLQCSGPFSLKADEITTVLVGVMFAQWYQGSIVRPDTALVKVDNMAQYIYNMNWLLPGPPPPPKLTCIPSDQKVTLIWDNSSETAVDPYYAVVSDTLKIGTPVYDSFYIEYDFQGYRVWKSKTANAGTWYRLGSYDLYDNIMFTDIVSGETLAATNTGLVHSFTDTDVRNGFSYYYAVSAFDWNRVKVTDSTWRPIYFESGYVQVAAVPRREPANYLPGTVSVSYVSGNPAIAVNNVAAEITYPLAMTADPFYLDFGPIGYDAATKAPRYSASLVDNAVNRVDSCAVAVVFDTSVTMTVAPYQFQVFHGINVTAVFTREDIPNNTSIFDTVIIESGNYPDSLVSVVTAMQTNWAYRGSGFHIEWINAYGSDSANSIIVVDVVTGDTIPFKPYRENAATDSFAGGWCFRASAQSTDTLVYGTAGTGTRSVYICGGKFMISLTWMSVGDEPRPGVGDVWTVKAASYQPAPFSARVQITPTPAMLDTMPIKALNVKVVPNPYIIANEWQQSFRLRRLRFINLPAKCTVRVFNLNGELVKTLIHSETVVSDEGSNVTNNNGGDEWWDLLSENRQLVASGIYIFHVQSDVGEQVGKFVVIR